MFNIKNIQDFNDLEMSVYQYVIQHQDAIPYMRIRELASDAHVSTTTILRFCKKAGCDGYLEFKLKMKEYIGNKVNVHIPEDLSELRAFLERMDSGIYQQKLNEAASMIAQADRVFCVGVSNSGYVAQYAARYFSGFGKFSMAVTDPFYPMWQMNEVQNTVALVFSISGEVSQVIQITNQLKQHNCRIVSITNTEKCTVAQMAELNLCHYITMRRGENNTDFKKHQIEAIIDYTSQVPAIIVAETLAKRVAGYLLEE
ncbi:MAG: MurR/RpiR family transcriptional regulator [Lachnospiraceae bacterium]